MAASIDSASENSVAPADNHASANPAENLALSAADVTDPVALVHALGDQARAVAPVLASASTAAKNAALVAIADAIDSRHQLLLDENAEDLQQARDNDISAAMLDRLELTPDRITGMARGLRDIAAQADPIGEMSASVKRPNGLEIARMRVPLGVIGVIYESRPNVTADAAGICLKAGNPVILRGGSEAIRSNRAIAACIDDGLAVAGLPAAAVQLVPTTDRAAVGAMLELQGKIDVIIPRGGKSLVARVSDQARVPVIKHLDGICHVFIDKGADRQRAIELAVNAKTYRYGICGAMETLLIDSAEAADVLPEVVRAFAPHEVELRGCARCQSIVPSMAAATDEDWQTEYLAPILSIRVVDDVTAAIKHIEQYGSGHTDAIVTNDIGRSREFTERVDSSSVLVNAATCFADGAQYGLGAEIGISTDRMHVRGPVGVVGLTTEKYVVRGDYTLRN